MMSDGAREDLRREGVGRPDPVEGRPGPGIPDRRGALGVECDMGRARMTSGGDERVGTQVRTTGERQGREASERREGIRASSLSCFPPDRSTVTSQSDSLSSKLHDQRSIHVLLSKIPDQILHWMTVGRV